MEWLCIILLQDAAILQKSYPGSPLWQYEVFFLPDWNVFATDVMSVYIRAEMPKDMLLTVIMLCVAEAIDENRQAFMKMFERYSIRSSQEHDMALNLMKDLFSEM